MIELYEITAALKDALDRSLEMAEENAGEISNDLSRELDHLQMSKEQKVLEIGRMYKNARAQSEAIEKEEKKLRDRRKAIDRHTDWMREKLQEFLTGNERYADENTRISWRKSERVIINDLAALEKLSKDCVKIEISPRLTETKEKIKAGLIPSSVAAIEVHNNIQIK